MSPVWRSATKYIVAIGLLAFGLWTVYLSRPVIPLLIFAALVALMVNPVERFLRSRVGLPLWLAILIAYIFFLVVIAVLLWSLLTSLSQTVRAFEVAFGSISMNGLAAALQQLRTAALPVPGLNEALSNGTDQLLAALRGATGGGPAAPLPAIPPWLSQILQQTFTIGITGLGSLLADLTNLTLIVLLAVYLSLSHEWLFNGLMDKVPVPYRPEIGDVLSRIQSIWAGYLRGQVLLQLIVGVLVWLGLTLLGLSGAVALGFMAAILYLIPNIGLPVAAVPAALLAASFGSSHLAIGHGTFALVVVAFYVLLTILVNTFVVPIVMSSSLNLHPFVFTVGILVGAAAAGVLGAVLAAPVIATGQVVVGYLYAKILQQPAGEEETRASQLDLPAVASSVTGDPTEESVKAGATPTQET